jgi:hypothetical protein
MKLPGNEITGDEITGDEMNGYQSNGVKEEHGFLTNLIPVVFIKLRICAKGKDYEINR